MPNGTVAPGYTWPWPRTPLLQSALMSRFAVPIIGSTLRSTDRLPAPPFSPWSF